MGPGEIFVNSALSSLLFLGGASTPASNLRPVEGFYSRDGISAHRSLEEIPLSRPTASADRWNLFVQQTSDAGATLRPWGYGEFRGTGEVRDVFPVARWHRGTLTDSLDSLQVIDVAPPALPVHTRAVLWIQNATGMSEGSLANLLNVERMTIRNWKAGKPIKEASLRALVETRDVLRRAQRWHPHQDELKAWLQTPDPDHGISPAKLLSQGEFDRARFLAVLAPSIVEPKPDWVNRSVPAAWQDALQSPHRPGEFLEDTS
jgi:hypothetical protein